MVVRTNDITNIKGYKVELKSIEQWKAIIN